ncbi:cyclic nucleotide-binding protein [Acinetobacter sp. Ac_877]|uniref:Crp/Fnr family transcriptional regulator n=1 Tax=Acinetobacter portensis TaxID=1839785 RepID=UPI00128DA1BB|nr:Crp/Fnr family transcriptional regulator [Acinetobacter portensis]MPW40555.1 cyclic nucleotide-binding protein [Acinetobacter portensis]
MLELRDIKQLENNVWFSELPPIFQTFILEKSQLLHAEKDQKIFLSGDIFNGLYAVLEGSVRLGYIDIQGKEAVAAIVEPIMWFGEISLVDQQPRSHDAIATRKSVILHIHAQEMIQLLNDHPQFWFYIAKLTSQKLRFAFLELISIQTQTIYQRLAQRLLVILGGYGNHLHIENNIIHLSQEQLAQMLVCSRQTINQELQNLEKQGVIKVTFKRIEVLDNERLQKIAYNLNEQNK